MPFGVPKVTFQSHEEEEATWIDLYNRLYRERILFLCREIKEELANNLVSLMVFLDIDHTTWTQTMFIHSPGGFVFPGLAIYDTVLAVGARTVCAGIAASMASVVLIGGEQSKRLAFPHALLALSCETKERLFIHIIRVMIHQPRMKDFEDSTSGVIMETRVLLDLRERIVHIYVQRTGQPHRIINADLEVDTYMSAKEAMTYGIIDAIAQSVEE
uniref:ATP-dependent Clp protease proteolytic subunit n=2 Tax=Erodium TaxID=21555 RepID=A0A096XCQ9_9ROSI|nr:clp protease proteolytic subunit [Erodium rupestre]AHF21100.1 clp protease proteolytic subunit [Erodium rupestre]AHG24636.1 clp protease proteolytic subunit [Erodium foetidum subsp. foetidum]